MFSFVDRIVNYFGYHKPTKYKFRNFGAAKTNDLTLGWLTECKNINDILHSDLDKIRERSRDLMKNSDYAVKYRELLENNIIGPNGIKLQSRSLGLDGNYDEELSEYIEKHFKIWCDKYCDLTKQQNMTEFCKSLIGSMPCDGEFLVYIVNNNSNDNPYGISLQRLDVATIDTNKQSINNSYDDSENAIINGIQVTQSWERISIHFKDKSDTRELNEPFVMSMKNLIHGFKIKDANQTRGIPWMVSGILTLHHLHGYMMSASLAAQHGANQVGFITTNAPDPLNVQEKPEISLPLKCGYLPTGSDFKQVTSQYPEENFDSFVKTILKRIASGWGVSYSSLTGDLEAVNYSSMRAGLLQERENWINIQSWFISVFMDKIFKIWLKRLYYDTKILDMFKISNDDIGRFMLCDWQPKRWDWVDPKNDALAKLALVKAGVMPADALSSSMGYDYKDNLDKMAKLKEYSEALGLKINLFEEKNDTKESI